MDTQLGCISSSVSLNEAEVTRGVDADQADENKQKFNYEKSLAADYIIQS